MSAQDQPATELTEAGRKLSEGAKVLDSVREARAAVVKLHILDQRDPALREAHWYMTRAYGFMTNYVKSLEREVAGL